MVSRHGIRSVFFVAAIMLLPCVISLAGNPKGTSGKVPLVVEGISFSASSISDRQGNFIGVTIPLKQAGRLLLLEGTIDNVTGNFILDTGASGLVLNKTYFRNSMTFDDEEGGGVTGSTEAVSRIRVKRLAISELIFTNISADVIPLGHIENRRGVKILGLIGMSLFRHLEMVIDIRRNELQIFRLDKYGSRVGSATPAVKYDIIQKMEEFNHVMFVKAVIGGKILDFCLDTGAESNVISIDCGKKVLGTVTITRRSNLNGAGESREEVLYGTLNEFTLSNRQMAPMETILCSMVSMSQKYGYPIDGMLGYDFFMKGKIYINLVKKEMGICLKTEDRK